MAGEVGRVLRTAPVPCGFMEGWHDWAENKFLTPNVIAKYIR